MVKMMKTNHYASGKFHMLFQTFVILLGMALLFGLIGWLLLGGIGIVWAMIIALILFLSTPKLSPWMVFTMYQARMLAYNEIPELHEIVHELSRRAQLESIPQLYYVPSRLMNAFSVGTSGGSAIAVSDGIIRFLSWREVAGVLAHEISHIQNSDLRLLSLADLMTRITSILSFFGQVLIILYLPLAFFSKSNLPLVPILLLIFAPSLSVLLQLALSRTREFNADLGAARLTGDPEGLASALKKMDQFDQNIWDYILLSGRKPRHPSFLRTHPHTKERLERLMSLDQEASEPFMDLENENKFPDHFAREDQRPRWFRPWH
jgi:heat shock protein HtpX